MRVKAFFMAIAPLKPFAKYSSFLKQTYNATIYNPPQKVMENSK